MIDSLEQLPICQPLCLSVFFHFFISIPLCFFTTLLLFNLLLLSITTIFPHFNLITSNYFLTLFCSMTMMTTTTNSNTNAGLFGDTTLTKVFVGGLAWETPKEAMRDHFQKFGEILEAVIISDKLTGRSKGYGFVSDAVISDWLIDWSLFCLFDWFTVLDFLGYIQRRGIGEESLWGFGSDHQWPSS